MQPSRWSTIASRGRVRRCAESGLTVRDMRVAIVGYGLAARVFHAPLIAATNGLEVTAIVTRTRRGPGRRSLITPKCGWSRASPIYRVRMHRSLWWSPRRNSSHAPSHHGGDPAGVAVVVEKPPAVTAAEAQELRADRADVLLTVFQNRRWDADQLTLRQLIEEGALGEVTRYESRFERWRPNARSGHVARGRCAGEGRRRGPRSRRPTGRSGHRIVRLGHGGLRASAGRVFACRERSAGSLCPTWIRRTRHCAPAPARTRSTIGESQSNGSTRG
jgi:hypothetical protein